MMNYMKEIGLAPSLEARLIELINKDEKRIKELAQRCKDKGFSVITGANDMTRLAVAIAYLEYTKAEYKRLEIPMEIFYDTIKDIAVWCENNQNKGLKNINWIKNHLNAQLFKIGRLQYQLFTINDSKLDYSYFPFNKGEKLIYVHIPQGEKLLFADCVNSLKHAKDFFEKSFPEYEYQFFFCESWLLFEDNWQFMEPSSNILQFQSLFDIVMSSNDDHQAIERVFGKRRLLKTSYPTNTALQKSLKEYMLKGNKAGIGIGLIDKDEI